MQKKGKVLAVDYGKKRVGIATGDFEFGIAFPRTVIINKGFDDLINKISDLCNELEIKFIVVGLPLKLKESARNNPIMKDVILFVDKLKERFKSEIDVELLDERLSSFEADNILESMGGNFNKEKLPQDAYAAQIILQRFFDK